MTWKRSKGKEKVCREEIMQRKMWLKRFSARKDEAVTHHRKPKARKLGINAYKTSVQCEANPTTKKTCTHLVSKHELQRGENGVRRRTHSAKVNNKKRRSYLMIITNYKGVQVGLTLWTWKQRQKTALPYVPADMTRTAHFSPDTTAVQHTNYRYIWYTMKAYIYTRKTKLNQRR